MLKTHIETLLTSKEPSDHAIAARSISHVIKRYAELSQIGSLQNFCFFSLSETEGRLSEWRKGETPKKQSGFVMMHNAETQTPETEALLKALKAAGVRLTPLSNYTRTLKKYTVKCTCGSTYSYLIVRRILEQKY